MTKIWRLIIRHTTAVTKVMMEMIVREVTTKGKIQ